MWKQHLRERTTFVFIVVSIIVLCAPSSLGIMKNTITLNSQQLSSASESLDLACTCSQENDIYILMNNGSGGFVGTTIIPVGSIPYGIATGDFNNDLALDLVASNTDDNNISVILGNGDGTFGNLREYHVGSLPSDVVTADINNDGNLDILVSCLEGLFISVFLGNGTGYFSDRIDTLVLVPTSLAIGDLNEDGNLDMAVTAVYRSVISVFFGVTHLYSGSS